MFDKVSLNRLYCYALSLTKADDQAYDILHSSLEKYLSQRRCDVVDAVSYVMRIIKHEFIDAQRERQRYLVLVETSAEELQAEPPLALDDIYIRSEQVEQILTSLAPEDRELLYLWAVEEYRIRELADLLGIPKGTLLSRMHRLKKRLRAELEVNADESGRAHL